MHGPYSRFFTAQVEQNPDGWLLGSTGADESCNVSCLMRITITLTTPAYERLRRLKAPGESFSQMVLRELPKRLETCGELEDYFAKHGVPKANPKLERAMLSGRGRRSKRGKL